MHLMGGPGTGTLAGVLTPSGPHALLSIRSLLALGDFSLTMREPHPLPQVTLSWLLTPSAYSLFSPPP